QGQALRHQQDAASLQGAAGLSRCLKVRSFLHCRARSGPDNEARRSALTLCGQPNYRARMQKIHLTVLSAVLVVLTAGTSVLAQQSTARQQAPEKPYHQQIREEPPQSRAESTKVLSNLYAHLAAATDAQSAKEIAETIERLWLLPYSDTIAVLMERSATALAQKNNALALKLLDAVVDLAPDYAEGWHRRAV